MTDQSLPFLIPYFLSLAFSIGVGMYAWQRRAQKGAAAYALMALGQALWTFGYIFELTTPDLAGKVFWDNFQWLGMQIVPAGAFVFAFQYSERRVPYRQTVTPLLIVIPVIIIFLSYTNPAHHLIGFDHRLVPGTPFDTLTYAYGTVFWIATAYYYLMMLIAVGVLLGAVLRAPKHHRAQLALVMFGLSIPLLGTLLAVFNITLGGQRDISPFSFAISNVFVVWALARYRLLNIVPIARDKVVESMDDAVIVVDMQNRVVDINPAGLKGRGLTADRVIGRSVDEVYSDWQPLLDRFHDVFEARVKVDIQVDGRTRWYELSISPLLDRDRQPTGRLLVNREITAQEDAAQLLRDQQARLEHLVEARTSELKTSNETLRREIAERKSVEEALRLAQFTIDHATEAVIWADETGTLLYANEVAARAVNATAAEMIGRKIWDVKHDVTEETWRDRWNSTREKGAETVEISITAEKGQTRYLEAAATHIVFDGRELYVSYGRDITERKKMEAALQESEQAMLTLYLTAARQNQTLTLLDRVRTALASEVDLASLFRAIMTSVSEIFGYTQVSIYLLRGDKLVLQDHTGYEIVFDEIPLGTGVIGRVTRSGEPVLIEDVSTDPDYLAASPGVVSEVCVPLMSEGKAIGALNVESTRGVTLTQDDLKLTIALGEIIEVAVERGRLYEGLRQELVRREQVEGSLRESEVRFRSLVESSQAGIFLVDDNLNFVYINQRLAELFGYSVVELMSMDMTSLVEEPVREMVIGRYRSRVHGEPVPSQYEFDGLHRSGQKRRMELVVSRVQLPDGKFRLLGQVMDVTERWKAAEAIRRYAERLASLHQIDRAILIEETPEAIAAVALARMRQLVPLVSGSVMLFNQAENYAEVLAMVSAARRDGPVGTRIPLDVFDVTGLSEGHSTIVRRFEDVIKPGHPYHETMKAEGIQAYVNVPMTAQGRLIGALTISAAQPNAFGVEEIEIAREVADQLAVSIQHASLRQEILRHSQELEMRVAERTAMLEAANEHLKALARVKDEFVANVSHELRTPITNIKLYLDLLSAGTDKRGEYLDTLRRENLRLENLIENLLLLSRLDRNSINLNPAPVDLNEVAGQYAADRGRLAETRQLALTLETEQNLPAVTGSRDLIGQALSIFLTNALNYTPPGGSVGIRTRVRREDGQAWSGVIVEDTGPGLAPEDMDRLFTRFFRGKVGAGSGVAGTGLGLAIAREIVERHRGRIRAANKPGPEHGAVFEFWLPTEDPNSP